MEKLIIFKIELQKKLKLKSKLATENKTIKQFFTEKIDEYLKYDRTK